MKRQPVFCLFMLCIAVFFLFSVAGCLKVALEETKTEVALEKAKTDVLTMAETVCRQVGKVGQYHSGGMGSPIFILEEVHDSRAGQIQHAIVLHRLYHQYGLRHIGLEGYLIDGPVIDTGWYEKAAAGDLIRKATVAVRLLKEGEINCAEFMKLVYRDLYLHPIEKAAEYNVELGLEPSVAPKRYLLKMAMRSLHKEHEAMLMHLLKEVQNAPPEIQPEKYLRLHNYVLSVDPWCREKADRLLDINEILSMSLSEHLELVEQIRQRALEMDLQVEPQEKMDLDNYILFLKRRSDASQTMAAFISDIKARERGAPVAIITGLTHTGEICNVFKKRNHPYVVITPLLSVEAGKLTMEMIDRKYERRSIFTEGALAEIIENAFFAPYQKKPRPVLSEPWMIARGEIFLFTDRIVVKLLSPGSGYGGEGIPPTKLPPGGLYFKDEDLRGEYVFIDPRRIEIIPAGEDMKDSDGPYAVFFPTVINYKNINLSREIWVKAVFAGFERFPEAEADKDVADRSEDVTKAEKDVSGRSEGMTKAEKDADDWIERMLKEALKEVESEEKTSEQMEDESGNIQCTVDTLLFAGKNPEVVRKANLSGK